MRKNPILTGEARIHHNYLTQRSAAKTRTDRNGDPITFSLTYEEWREIWDKSGKLAERGKRRGCYVMSRFNDEGGYEVGNVEIITTTENLKRSHALRKN